MENNKDVESYLDADCACDAFSFSMDVMLASSCGIVLVPLCLSQCRIVAAQCT